MSSDRNPCNGRGNTTRTEFQHLDYIRPNPMQCESIELNKDNIINIEEFTFLSSGSFDKKQ